MKKVILYGVEGKSIIVDDGDYHSIIKYRWYLYNGFITANILDNRRNNLVFVSTYRSKPVKCTFSNCINRYVAKGLCKTHYSRMSNGNLHFGTSFDKRSAITEGVIAKVPLGVNAKNGYAIIDKEDVWIDKYKWSKSTDGYVVARINKEAIYLHRLIMKKPDSFIDHKDTDKLNNRRSNLRICNNGQNMCNTKPNIRNTSGYKGVSWDKRRKNWRAYISANGVRYELGHFDSRENAASTYNNAAIELHRKFARLNVL